MVVLKSSRILLALVLGGALVSGARAETKHHWNPDVTRSADGFFYVTWFNRTDANIQLQKISTSGAVQWTNSIQVNTISLTYSTGWEPTPQVAVFGSTLYVAWARGFQELRMMKLDTDGNRLWATEKLINSVPCETRGHDMAVDSSGYVMADAWEATHFGSSLDCAAEDDDDGDGASNYREYVADTVPTNKASLFRVHMPATPPPSVYFNASSARSYSLEGATNLASPVTWTPIGDPVSGNGDVMSLADTDAGARLYYRVKVQVP